MSDAVLSSIGSVLERGCGYRDAVHIAIVPVLAAEVLSPGQRVGIIDRGTENVSVGKVQPHNQIGVIDPFLPTMVLQGQRCYLFLFPGSVVSLRHEWTHPAFMDSPSASTDAVTKAKIEIEMFASKMCRLSYDELMDQARRWVLSGETACAGTDSWREIDEYEWSEFWSNYGIVTGGKANCNRGNMFDRCAC